MNAVLAGAVSLMCELPPVRIARWCDLVLIAITTSVAPVTCLVASESNAALSVALSSVVKICTGSGSALPAWVTLPASSTCESSCSVTGPAAAGPASSIDTPATIASRTMSRLAIPHLLGMGTCLAPAVASVRHGCDRGPECRSSRTPHRCPGVRLCERA
ncbi:hypothetical protein EBN03_16440 [Nocardia stercoris]|uniref:Uncharacterized protein n=1 Tax=Nocardia stercoris TaxID=2483361 RepID=A0A3M2L230_9NOCA|nr:hypothetical protein EBN03_16440 [Nocardia stercoris]